MSNCLDSTKSSESVSETLSEHVSKPESPTSSNNTLFTNPSSIDLQNSSNIDILPLNEEKSLSNVSSETPSSISRQYHSSDDDEDDGNLNPENGPQPHFRIQFSHDCAPVPTDIHPDHSNTYISRNSSYSGLSNLDDENVSPPQSRQAQQQTLDRVHQHLIQATLNQSLAQQTQFIPSSLSNNSSHSSFSAAGVNLSLNSESSNSQIPHVRSMPQLSGFDMFQMPNMPQRSDSISPSSSISSQITYAAHPAKNFGDAILVTGGGGFLGHNLIERLVSISPNQVICFDICSVDKISQIELFNSIDKRDAMAKLWENARKSFLLNENLVKSDNKIVFYKGSITRADDLIKAITMYNVTTVFHTASSVANSTFTKENHFHLNFFGTKNVIEACLHCQVHQLIYTSNACVVSDNLKDIVNGDETLEYVSATVANDFSSSIIKAESLVLNNNGRRHFSSVLIEPKKNKNRYSINNSKYRPGFSSLAKSIDDSLSPNISPLLNDATSVLNHPVTQTHSVTPPLAEYSHLSQVVTQPSLFPPPSSSSVSSSPSNSTNTKPLKRRLSTPYVSSSSPIPLSMLPSGNGSITTINSQSLSPTSPIASKTPPSPSAIYTRRPSKIPKLTHLFTAAIRPQFLFGPRDPHILPSLMQKASDSELFRPIGLDQKLIDITFVDNAVDAHIACWKRLLPGSPVAGEAFFITNNEPRPYWDFISSLLKGMGIELLEEAHEHSLGSWAKNALSTYLLSPLGIRIEKQSSTFFENFLLANIRTNCSFSTTKALRLLGYVPGISLDDGISKTVHFFLLLEAHFKEDQNQKLLQQEVSQHIHINQVSQRSKNDSSSEDGGMSEDDEDDINVVGTAETSVWLLDAVRSFFDSPAKPRKNSVSQSPLPSNSSIPNPILDPKSSNEPPQVQSVQFNYSPIESPSGRFSPENDNHPKKIPVTSISSQSLSSASLSLSTPSQLSNFKGPLNPSSSSKPPSDTKKNPKFFGYFWP